MTTFVDSFTDVFIPRVVGVSDSDNFAEPIDSTQEAYIKSQIGARYLSDSTVTILFVGRCTWARRYVDWELSSTLRDDPVNRRNGLLAITPPDNTTNTLPSRFSANYVQNGQSYARYYYYPTNATHLRTWIETAFRARANSDLVKLIDNSAPLRKRDSAC